MRMLFFALLVLFVAGCATGTPAANAAAVAPAPAPIPKPPTTPAPAAEPREVVGYLFRAGEGAVAIDPIDPVDASSASPRLPLAGPLAAQLASRIDGARAIPAKTASEGITEPAYEEATLVSAVGSCGPRDRPMHLSPVVVRLRGALRAGTLEVTEVLDDVDAAAWGRAKKEYIAALARAEGAFGRSDAKGARRALEEARDVVAKTFGEIAPLMEVYRFIDGLATRFATACDRIADRSRDAVAYADAVTPLHRARTMKGREWPLAAESSMVLAAFRFARRAVYRELRAERGEAHDFAHARAIIDMAPVGHDVEMLHWVMQHVPEARR